jgi:hypothetical protein
MTGGIVTLQKINRKLLGPSRRFPFCGCQISACGKNADIREMPLQPVLSFAFHFAASLNRAANLGEDTPCICTDQVHRPHHNDKDHESHNGVLGYILAFVSQDDVQWEAPQFTPH